MRVTGDGGGALPYGVAGDSDWPRGGRRRWGIVVWLEVQWDRVSWGRGGFLTQTANWHSCVLQDAPVERLRLAAQHRLNACAGA